MLERVRKLDPAPRHPGMLLAPHLQRSIVRERLPRLFDLALAREDKPGQDQGLRLGAALDQAAVDEHLIGAGFRHPPSLPPGPELQKEAKKVGFAQRHKGTRTQRSCVDLYLFEALSFARTKNPTFGRDGSCRKCI
jgi:hypothetical protein